MLHVISAQCVARDLHAIVPGRLSVRLGDSSRCSEEIAKKSQIAPLSAIIVVVVAVVRRRRRIVCWLVA